ncbi:unnamed protein product [Calicophoron daubneyi]|uniref:Uncharacterized protein n=1 Tax=Calicophoron daubneyi TaxID=300641 RepID=A0AAV2T1L0_CALDB
MVCSLLGLVHTKRQITGIHGSDGIQKVTKKSMSKQEIRKATLQTNIKWIIFCGCLVVLMLSFALAKTSEKSYLLLSKLYTETRSSTPGDMTVESMSLKLHSFMQRCWQNVPELRLMNGAEASPAPPMRAEFRDERYMAEYVRALNWYYQIFGRARYG